MLRLANLNGVVLPLEEAKVSVLDRGFLFGDAVYEVVRIYQGRLFLFDEHLKRLEQSLMALRIRNVDMGRLKDRAVQLVKDSHCQDATLYCEITRGTYPTRAHLFPEQEKPTELLFISPFEDTGAKWRVEGCSVITYPDIRWERCDIKSVNLLGNILAAQAAKEAGAYESILVTKDGMVTEGSRTNLFIVDGGKLVTSPCDPAILPGITRETVLKLARKENISIEERAFSIDTLKRAREVFLCGTTTEVTPIVRVDGKAIADGKPGPLTLQLKIAYGNEVRKGTVP